MDTQRLEQIYVPGLGATLSFDRDADFLGKGTAGEVFCARTEQKDNDSPNGKCYALKIFLDRGERPHFARECKVLEDLALVPHPNILSFLHYWTSNSFQYILFPLARGDLYTFLRGPVRPQPGARFTRWFVQQLWGLCDALKYIHNHALPVGSSEHRAPMRRIGFHHDIKPVNILLFDTGNPAELTWKLSDFGSGLVSEFQDSDHESIYNSKPSTGDPIYTSPEFALEGRVSRPKDVWSLGCIYLETLIWISDPSRAALDEFQEARFPLPDGRRARKPMYWYQDQNGEVHIHPVVREKIVALHKFFETMEPLENARLLVASMLAVSQRERATASKLCDGFDIILQGLPRGVEVMSLASEAS